MCVCSAGMLQRLQLDSEPDDMSFISCIAKTMFKDHTTNWGRIVSLVAFGAVVCTHLKELQRERCVEMVAEQISSYLISEQHDWLLNNKSWVSDHTLVFPSLRNSEPFCVCVESSPFNTRKTCIRPPEKPLLNSPTSSSAP